MGEQRERGKKNLAKQHSAADTKILIYQEASARQSTRARQKICGVIEREKTEWAIMEILPLFGKVIKSLFELPIIA